MPLRRWKKGLLYADMEEGYMSREHEADSVKERIIINANDGEVNFSHETQLWQYVL